MAAIYEKRFKWAKKHGVFGKLMWILTDALIFVILVYLLSNISDYLIWGENNFGKLGKIIWMIVTGLIIGWLNWRHL
jgi:hypothetical protein